MAESSSALPPFPSPSPSPSPEAPEKTTGGLWYVGAIINVVGSVSINLGMNLMKLGHTKRAQLDMPEEEKPPIRKFKTWLIGIIVFITGNILNFVSFAFAAQSLLAALGSLQLVCNVFFAYFVNHEAVTKLIILSTCCIIGGCVLLVVFGNQSSETYTVDQLIHFYTLPAYVVYLVMMAVFVFGFYVLYLHSKKVCRKRGERGLWYGFMLVSYAIFSALLGSQSVLFGKSISVILRTTFTESNQLGNWYTWVVLPLFTFTALFWVTRLNKGLRMFPAMIIVPLLQIAWTLFSIVSGMLYFQEYKGFTTLKAIMFPVGVLIVFIGVFILTSGGRAPPEEEEKEEVGETPEDGQRPPKVSMYDNAMYSARSDMDGHPVDTPYGPHTQSKMSLGQTLRFTSTWAPPSVAVSPGSNLNRTLVPSDTLRRQPRLTGPSDLNATDITNRTEDLTPTTSVAGEQQHQPGGGGGGGQGGWGNRTYDRNSTLNRTAQSTMSKISETSMVSTMRKGLKSVGSALTSDMGLNMSGFKLAVGLGDSNLAGVSLFTMPALDFTATTRRKTERTEHRSSRIGTRNTEISILSALPRSRFYKGDPDNLTVIREASGAPPTSVPHSPGVGPSPTDSSQLPASSLDSINAAAAATAATGRVGSTTSTQIPDVGRSTSTSQPREHPPAFSGRVPPDQPLTEAAMMNLLPVPSFLDSRSTPLATSPAEGGEQPQQQQQQQASGSVSASEAPKGPPPGRTGQNTQAAGPPVWTTGAIGSGGSQPGSGQRAQRSRRPSALPESGQRIAPPCAAGLGGLAGAASGLHPGYDSDAYPSARTSPPLQPYRSGGGGDADGGGIGGAASYDGPVAAGAVGPGVLRAPRASLPKPGSFGAILPEGVPLSTANSVVIHESGAATPPEGLVGMGGIGMSAGMGQQHQQQLPRPYGQHGGELWPGGSVTQGGGIVQLPQSQSQSRTQLQSGWRHSRASQLPQTQQNSLQLQQASLLQQQFQQQFQQQQPLPQQQSVQSLHQQQQAPQQIPLSLLHRTTAPPAGTVRLPALHLMIPGLPVSPPQPQTALTAASTGGMGTPYLQHGPSSLSYAQMLTGQGVFTEPGALVLQQNAMSGPVGGSVSLGGAGPAGAGLTAVRLHGRSQAPHGSLSVSRSWAGLSAGGAGGVGTAVARRSPLRGALVQQMQRPLQPWQQH